MLDLSFSIPKVNSRSPLYQPMRKFLILAAANYLLNCFFWTKTFKTEMLHHGLKPGVTSVQTLPLNWFCVHLLSIVIVLYSRGFIRVQHVSPLPTTPASVGITPCISIVLVTLCQHRLDDHFPRVFSYLFDPPVYSMNADHPTSCPLMSLL